MTTIHADVETRSPVDLRTAGAFVYFEHPDTSVLMLAYRIDDTSIKVWTFDQPCPPELAEAIVAGATIVAHNAQFETLAFDWLAKNRGWPKPAYDCYRCTAATAAAMGLPRSLDKLGEALGLATQKDKDGSRLIRKFSMPRKPKGAEPDGLYWNEPKDHPEDWQKFIAYCVRDVEAEEEAERRMVPLSDFEQRVWLLDQEINRRGIRIDTASARAAVRLADKAKAKLDREMRLATGGYVGKCSEPGKLVEWVQSQGVELTSAAKAEITDLLECDDIPANVRKALEIRQEAAKTSVSKLNAMLARASGDGRVRGSFLYHGASTGRWSNTGVNFANMPRPRRIFDDAKPRPDLLFNAIRREDPDLLGFLYGPDLGRPLHLLSDAIRGFVWAAPGHDLVQADYAGIEGAVIAWLAGEDWKLAEMFKIIADPSIPDLYRQTAAAIMSLSTDVITKKHPLRQSVGKVSELALGFAGGVAAFYAMARGYGVNLDALYDPVWGAADDERRAKAEARYETCLKLKQAKADVLSREAWIACEIIKLGWRAANPAIAASWPNLERAVREAVQNPGTITQAARVSYIVANGFLWAKLPSGRCLAYGNPRVTDQVWIDRKVDGEWISAGAMDRETAERLDGKGEVRVNGASTPKVTALGVNSVTKAWERFALYGGIIQENNTQATARDLLVNGMLKAEDAGYPVIATVYDEIICERPRGEADIRAFERLICELPPWAEGIPLTAGGWVGKRYRKD
ncbi:MAG: DNA polymerase [Hyphomonas sp.]|nr:DNA polymerase [Hyphomonas sp.]